MRSRVLAAALVAMGLLAGLFYAYACSVMPGLSDAGDRSFIDSMQQINKAIENPVFFLTFLGAPVLAIGRSCSSGAPAPSERRAGSPPRSPSALSAWRSRSPSISR
jgi:hypothetical protein